MLDLAALKDKTYDIKLENGEVLHIKRPTQKMTKGLLEMSNFVMSDVDHIKKADKLFDYVTSIFNYNTDNKKFKRNEIEEILDISLSQYIIKDYMAFSNNLLKDPN